MNSEENSTVRGNMSEGTVEKHIGVLDGIRALSILFVVWYHFWQQTWLTPYINFDSTWTKYLGVTQINLASCVRYGFTFVDMLVLLSAFCNFYPYARAILLGESWPSTREFYFKRAVRILPSYLFCLIIVFFVFLIPEGQYESTKFMWKDILTTLTFTRGFFTDTVYSSKLNAVLWTVQVEILYYILLPWIAKLFRKLPGITYAVMMLTGIVSINYIIYQCQGREALYLNHMIAFMGVYANGILLSLLYVAWKKSGAENRYTGLASTVLSVCCIVWFGNILAEYSQAEVLQAAQLKVRLPQSFLFSGFILFTACAFEWWQKIFSNKLMKFICAISYNLYIWHQFIAVKLKQYRIPYWEGDTPPNMTGDKVWQWKYQILITAVSVLVAIVCTYGVELPVQKACERIRKKNEH